MQVDDLLEALEIFETVGGIEKQAQVLTRTHYRCTVLYCITLYVLCFREAGTSSQTYSLSRPSIRNLLARALTFEKADSWARARPGSAQRPARTGLAAAPAPSRIAWREVIFFCEIVFLSLHNYNPAGKPLRTPSN